MLERSPMRNWGCVQGPADIVRQEFRIIIIGRFVWLICMIVYRTEACNLWARLHMSAKPLWGSHSEQAHYTLGLSEISYHVYVYLRHRGDRSRVFRPSFAFPLYNESVVPSSPFDTVINAPGEGTSIHTKGFVRTYTRIPKSEHPALLSLRLHR
jgi:hypothetical protein